MHLKPSRGNNSESINSRVAILDQIVQHLKNTKFNKGDYAFTKLAQNLSGDLHFSP